MTRTKPRVRLKLAAFDAFMIAQGCDDDGAKAHALGLTRTVVLKTRADTQAPSQEFIAAVRTTYPRVPYSRFFGETFDPLKRPKREAEKKARAAGFASVGER